jgi:glycosyltransferase involved in cell wall biosynthesis
LLAQVRVQPSKLCTIPLTVLHEMQPPDAAHTRAFLEGLGITPGRYLLYPANFWPHKNHARLLEALAMLPDSRLQLVCPGEPDERLEGLCALASRLGVADRVRFPGYLPAAQLASLFQACRALIFPSLFEGFGLPVLEAMAFDKPVLCSNVTSLPEVVGEAAVLFDPTDPSAIGSAICRLESDPSLSPRLVELGRERLRVFGSPRRMAKQYLTIFRSVVS